MGRLKRFTTNHNIDAAQLEAFMRKNRYTLMTPETLLDFAAKLGVTISVAEVSHTTSHSNTDLRGSRGIRRELIYTAPRSLQGAVLAARLSRRETPEDVLVHMEDLISQVGATTFDRLRLNKGDLDRRGWAGDEPTATAPKSPHEPEAEHGLTRLIRKSARPTHAVHSLSAV
jgi:hypothetical protein